MKLDCLVIDDEPLARKGLKEYIADVDFLCLAGDFDSPLKATEVLHQVASPVLFLDIQMPKITGLQFLKSLPHPPPVIFTTAYPQHAVEGFELNALDYLVKPIAFERFLKAALKAKEYYELRAHNTHPSSTSPDHLFIKVDGKLLKIAYADILYVEAVQNYVAVHTAAKKHLAYITFGAMENFLPADRFMKTHKSYLVAIDKIERIEGDSVGIGTQLLPISRALKKEVITRLTGDRFLRR